MVKKRENYDRNYYVKKGFLVGKDEISLWNFKLMVPCIVIQCE